MKKPKLRNTILKWSSDGELSSIDMTKILDLFANKELTQCVLACDVDKRFPEIFFHLRDRL